MAFHSAPHSPVTGPNSAPFRSGTGDRHCVAVWSNQITRNLVHLKKTACTLHTQRDWDRSSTLSSRKILSNFCSPENLARFPIAIIPSLLFADNPLTYIRQLAFENIQINLIAFQLTWLRHWYLIQMYRTYSRVRQVPPPCKCTVLMAMRA
jgi:hypothetical protein